jgi:hypothetical protein
MLIYRQKTSDTAYGNLYARLFRANYTDHKTKLGTAISLCGATNATTVNKAWIMWGLEDALCAINLRIGRAVSTGIKTYSLSHLYFNPYTLAIAAQSDYTSLGKDNAYSFNVDDTMDIDRLGAYVVRTNQKTKAVNIYSILSRYVGVKNLTVNLNTAGADVITPNSVVVVGRLKNGRYLIREEYGGGDAIKRMQLETTLFLKEDVANG